MAAPRSVSRLVRAVSTVRAVSMADLADSFGSRADSVGWGGGGGGDGVSPRSLMLSSSILLIKLRCAAREPLRGVIALMTSVDSSSSSGLCAEE